ncbi:hypothetical protein [Methylomicrobium album]|uniref:hypothetical protein n=1 Tax=Methylomicrobium album TaxID=39775 RepID=UPI0002E7BC1F|nr:hypothetical protein [Methylomicrobium album]
MRDRPFVTRLPALIAPASIRVCADMAGQAVKSGSVIVFFSFGLQALRKRLQIFLLGQK